MEITCISPYDKYDESIPGAIECRDGIAVILGVLHELVDIVSGDNTDWNIAGSNHCERCIASSLHTNFFIRRPRRFRSKAVWL